MKTQRILNEYQARLTSLAETRAALSTLAAQAAHNALYADHPDSYNRWTKEGTAAVAALTMLV